MTLIRLPSARNALVRARHFQLQGDLAAGTVIAEGATAQEVLPIAGLLRGKIRAKLSAGTGTLRAKWVYPDAAGYIDPDNPSVHTTDNPSDVTISNTDEVVMPIEDFYGEAYLLVQVIDGGDGGATATIERVHFSAV